MRMSRICLCCCCCPEPIAMQLRPLCNILVASRAPFAMIALRSASAAMVDRPSSCLQVSEECKDVLMRLLVADSERRLSMDEIKGHPWFTHSLPSGANEMNDYYHNEDSGVDEVAVRPLTPCISTRCPHRLQHGSPQASCTCPISSELIHLNPITFRIELLILWGQVNVLQAGVRRQMMRWGSEAQTACAITFPESGVIGCH